MSADPEVLLAKYQRDFAAYENFLQGGAQTPSHIDPNETVLALNDADDQEDEAGDGLLYEGEAADEQSAGRHHAAHPHARSGDDPSTPPPSTAAATSGASASPAARPPAPHHAISGTAAAAVARAIAAHGGLDGPVYNSHRRVGHSNASNGIPLTNSRSQGQLMSSAPRPLYSTRTTNSRRHSSTGPMDEIDQLIEERLQSVGRYRSSAPPDALYIKSQAWSLRRRQINDAMRREQEALQLSACTFKPQLGPAAEAETAPGYLDPAGDEGPYAVASVAVTEDPAVAQHLARLEEARRRRREAQARLDGSRNPKWTGRTTVPCEFQLGGRVAEPIPSLRKPCQPWSGEAGSCPRGAHNAPSTATKSESKPRIAFGTVVSAERSSTSPHVPNRRSGGRANGSGATTRRRPNDQSVSHSDERQPLICAPPSQQQQRQKQDTAKERALSTADDDPDVDPDSVSAAAAATGVERSPIYAHDLVQRLSDQLSKKDAIIQEKMEDLERLHLELEAVKDTLRQISSLGTAQQ
ncbi:hypothetical protein ABL78_6085 [Leptomonas seymouri]|uniref:Uncharacterized protein n=1 Tax=Leptomonas seymouri TaxID=5684 RepID=A0A0N0P4I2_LEPSE|nr:hypothetical protein ABL78_6085 [Leptomonas seymouri]|eukprot:KPI84857.1 hypothetical protein ABL78_6085 [Leptomonas seymouri]